MPRTNAPRVCFDPTGKAIQLPDFIYEASGKYRLMVSVMGNQHFLGAWTCLDTATVQRDRALHSLKPWLRGTLPELVAKEDLTLLAPNPRLESLMGRLALLAPEGVARQGPRDRDAIHARLDRIEEKLDLVLKAFGAPTRK